MSVRFRHDRAVFRSVKSLESAIVRSRLEMPDRGARGRLPRAVLKEILTTNTGSWSTGIAGNSHTAPANDDRWYRQRKIRSERVSAIFHQDRPDGVSDPS